MYCVFGKTHVARAGIELAGASAEIGVTAFVAVTPCVMGAMWGRLTWGVFWQWDARLTTTALLFVTYIGYLAVRRLGRQLIEQRAKRRSAVLGMLAVARDPAGAPERQNVAQPPSGGNGCEP